MMAVFGRVYYARHRYPQMKYVEKEKKTYVTFEKKPSKHWVVSKNISKTAKAAILLSEDAIFFQHHGFDFQQLQKAFEENLSKKKFARGGSTITQQLAKNIFLSKEKKILRKVKEVFYTVALEALFSKDLILEYYLNIVELGRNIYGVQQASLYYFQKPASQLNAKEGAFLATLLPSPIRYSVSFHRKELTNYAQKRITLILTRLAQTGHISSSEAAYLEHFPLPFEMIKENIGDEFEDGVVGEVETPGIDSTQPMEETAHPEKIDIEDH